MPPLDNPRRERFAQEIAKGRTAVDAYQAAGFAGDKSHASRLRAEPEVADRIVALLEEALDETRIELKDIFRELKRLAFADVRKVAEWDAGPSPAEIADADRRRRRRPIASVRFKPSAALDDDTAAAIASVSQGRWGPKIALHDKRSALLTLARLRLMVAAKTVEDEPLVVQITKYLPLGPPDDPRLEQLEALDGNGAGDGAQG
jgi:phage terminase small subunit